ncbi:hypothetical protein [Nonomuraea sp. NPDC023979]|uniref:hypothetical protein n=1 Tax=Nonomuraea sp. NPDC023979 TaxID=3154796 RepID=UPI0034089B2F
MDRKPERGVLPCHWYENPDYPGERFLVPCCPERVQDLDAACTCELPVQELERLRAEAADQERRLRRAMLEREHYARALLQLPDGHALLDRAHRSAADDPRMPPR